MRDQAIGRRSSVVGGRAQVKNGDGPAAPFAAGTVPISDQVIVIESKGKPLAGNQNTEHKRKVAGHFERAGKNVTWRQLGEDSQNHVFRFQALDEAQSFGRDRRDELRNVLGQQPQAGGAVGCGRGGE